MKSLIVKPITCSTPSGHATNGFGSHDAPITQLSEHVQQVHTTLSYSSTASFDDSSNVACVAN